MRKLASVPDYGRVFPLYVPPIDWYFLTDDRPDYPMSFFLELEFSGHLDQARFQDAVDEALRRHPLLLCTIQKAKKGRLCWVPTPDRVWEIDWAPSDQLIEVERDFLDIRESTGLRIWVREGDERTRVSLQFHHAASDGTGGYRFVGDLLACYMRDLTGCEGKVELSDFDPRTLKARSSKMRSITMQDSSWKKFQMAVSEGWKRVGSGISPLTAPAHKPSRRCFPGMVTQSFPAADLATLRKAATSAGGTLNDLFLCKVFQAARQWNDTRRGKLCVMVPADMRDGHDFEMPACNMTTFTFITLRAGDVSDEEKLMELVQKDTLEIKNGIPQARFVNTITTAMEGPWLPIVMSLGSCFATCVFSNAGDPSRRFTARLPKKKGKISCDDFTLEAITGVPPLRYRTRCTLSSSIYGRNLTFSMRCDPSLFSEQDTAKFLSLFCDQLKPLLT